MLERGIETGGESELTEEGEGVEIFWEEGEVC